MKIDYYCFVADDLANGVFYKNRTDRVSIFDNLDFDMSVAKSLYKFAVYDKSTDCFYDENCEKISLLNKVVFPRCIIPEMDNLFNKLEENGAKLVVTKEQTDIIYNWPKYIQPVYRDVEVTTYGDFLKNFDRYKERLGKVFFKTKNKNIHAEVISVFNLQGMAFTPLKSEEDLDKQQQEEEVFSEPMYIVMTDKVKGFNDHRFSFLDKNQEVFISPKLEIVQDKDVPRIPVEYRNFVVDGKFVSSQSWVQNRRVPLEVTNLVRSVLDVLPKEMPKTFVLDILQFEENGEKKYDICEFNPISCSGYEEGSSIFLLEDNFSKDNMGYKPKEKELGED